MLEVDDRTDSVAECVVDGCTTLALELLVEELCSRSELAESCTVVVAVCVFDDCAMLAEELRPTSELAELCTVVVAVCVFDDCAVV